MAKEIPLTQGKVAIVDDDMFEYLSQWKWHYAQGRAARRVITEKGPRHRHMQWDILSAPPGFIVDHRDGNQLNNLRSNLRICTKAENNRNRAVHSNKRSSVYKGVGFVKANRSRPWRSQIYANGEMRNLGYYATEVEAALAYNEAALKYHGEFARLNEIPPNFL